MLTEVPYLLGRTRASILKVYGQLVLQVYQMRANNEVTGTWDTHCAFLCGVHPRPQADVSFGGPLEATIVLVKSNIC